MRIFRPRTLPRIAIALIAALFAFDVDGATLSDLFQKAKLRVAAGDFQGGLAALDELAAEAARPENEPARTALRPAAAFYRGVCLASLGKADDARAEFAIFTSANPDKGIDRNAYSKRVVAAFDDARKSGGRTSGGETVSSLAAAYRQMAFHRDGGTPPGPEWSSGAAKFLLTSDEIRAFARIGDEAERARFISTFWLGSDAAESGKRDDLRREFERRAAFADEHFSEGSVRGSVTDRGMVFILLGPPSGVIRRPIAAADDTPSMLNMNSPTNPAPRAPLGMSPSDQPANWREVWRYHRDLLPSEVPYQLVDFAFQTRIDYGKNVLQREPSVLRALEEARGKWRPRP